MTRIGGRLRDKLRTTLSRLGRGRPVNESAEAAPVGAPVNLVRRDTSPAALANDVEYGLQILRGYAGWSGGQGFSLEGKNALEIGPGINLAGALALKALGARRVYVADRWIAPWQEDYNPVFCRMMAERVRAQHPEWDASVFERVAENGYGGTLELIQGPAEQLGQLVPEKLDAIFSNAVLEHMVDHAQTVAALAAITAPNGMNFHQVDFRYHENFERPLDYLLLTPEEHRARALATHYEIGCQLRPHELYAMFKAAGFQVAWHPNAYAEEAYLAEFLPKLRESKSLYRTTPEELLREVGGLYVLRM